MLCTDITHTRPVNKAVFRVVDKIGQFLVRHASDAVAVGDGCFITAVKSICFGLFPSFFVAIIAMIPQNGRVVQSGVLRGAGDVRFVAICALLSVSILRPFLTWLFCYPLADTLPGLPVAVLSPWIAFLIDAIVRDRLLHHRIRQGKWLDIELS